MNTMSPAPQDGSQRSAFGARPLRLGAPRRTPERRRALSRVKDWTRARFSLSRDETIVVSEVACALPGCAPIETLVVFWTAGAKRHHFKIFKPVEEVIEDDLPPAWMKPALAFEEGGGCDCC